jgi:hypothetical protein
MLWVLLALALSLSPTLVSAVALRIPPEADMMTVRVRVVELPSALAARAIEPLDVDTV